MILSKSAESVTNGMDMIDQGLRKEKAYFHNTLPFAKKNSEIEMRDTYLKADFLFVEYNVWTLIYNSRY